MSFIAELKRRKVFRVAIAYVVSAWVLIQVVETVFPAFGLDDEVFRTLVIALAIGFIPVVILAWAFELTRAGLRFDSQPGKHGLAPGKTPGSPPSLSELLRYPRFSVPVLVLITVSIGTAALIIPRLVNSHWARMEAIPEILDLIENDDFKGAYELATRAEQYIPDDPVLVDLWPTISVRQTVKTRPSGAFVYYKEYAAPEHTWKALGRTPIESVRLPKAALNFKFEKEDYGITERSRESFDGTLTVELDSLNVPADSVNVPATEPFFLLTGFQDIKVSVPQFQIGRHEVSNREFNEFVISGGYENPLYWEGLAFVLDTRRLSFQEAMKLFRDPTGRPGPSSWQGGTYPSGEQAHPVQGVSWFEAVAFARYRGRELPTVRQWSVAALFPPLEEVELDYAQSILNGQFRGTMMALSNFSSERSVAVRNKVNAGVYGTYDQGGNVREWCWNATGDAPDADRYILGGSWADPSYLFTYAITESPWNRSETNGIRLVTQGNDADVASLKLPIPRPSQEKIAPVPDAIFEVYREFYDYDRTPLNAVSESTIVESTRWTRETVSFDASYGDERVQAHLFMPKNVDPPYQVVIYYPSSNAIRSRSSDELELVTNEFIIHSGRALVFPVIRGTYERNLGLETTWPDNTRAYSDNVMKWIQDFRRTIDYIETRDEFDLDRLGYYGWSWGGWNGPIVMALDNRIKAGVYVSGGIPPTLARPEASSASFASRVTAPVLMISGRHDVLRPVETYQKPMFESIGTPAELKRHAILEGGHLPPMNQVMRETLNWYDTYLGPIK